MMQKLFHIYPTCFFNEKIATKLNLIIIPSRLAKSHGHDLSGPSRHRSAPATNRVRPE